MTPAVALAAKAEFGRRLKAARKKAGLTQARLAELTGLDPVTISQIETGQREPGITRAARLAAALNVTLDELVGQV
jgi:transcriptional regulator with XRE-family HTH domain